MSIPLSRLPEDLLLLDNDIFTAWRYQKKNIIQSITDYITRFKVPPALSSTTVFEALRGFEKSAAASGQYSQRTQGAIEETKSLIDICSVLPFDQEAAIIAAYVFPRVNNKKIWADVFTAATAISHGHGVATRNRKHFQLIAAHVPVKYPSLRLVFWNP
jgi:predicted nucleic acid-binding protein